MKLELNEKIGGVSVKAVRDQLRRMGEHTWNEATFATEFKIGPYAAKRLIAEMVSQGLIEKKTPGCYQLSDKGIRLCRSLFLKRIDRKKADGIVAELLRRAKEINKRRELLWTVERVRVFGSYITYSPDLGDIDIAVDLKRKKVPTRLKDWSEWNFERATASGRKLSSMDSLFFGHREVMLILKARNRYLQFTRTDSVERIGATSKIIFERTTEHDRK